MSTTKDGGPAFPRPTAWTPDGEPHHSGDDGMSLRDYFAAAALSDCVKYYGAERGEIDNRSKAARCAYGIADAMLAARAKEGA